MGSASYNVSRSVSARVTKGYSKLTAATMDSAFEQNKKREIHESMEPSKALLREARDSENHPNTVPIILGLDTTGSMGSIPLLLIQEGLPKLIGNIIQRGIADPALLFLPVGDHECDKAPLQVAQFESGDEELDMWLTRTWLEKGGGGNGGESYLLAWYYAAFHTVTDAWEKRKEKGFLITIGDEPNLGHLPLTAIREIMGSNVPAQSSYTEEQLLTAAQEKWNVFHIHIKHNTYNVESWKQVLGNNLIIVEDYKLIPEVVASLIAANVKLSNAGITPVNTEAKPESEKPPTKLRL